MATIGYHCSHEQFAPSKLLAYVRRAEAAGFRAAMCSDRFHPWSDRRGKSGFAFPRLGTVLQATALPFGVVNAPGHQYHPAVIAHAAATLHSPRTHDLYLIVTGPEGFYSGGREDAEHTIAWLEEGVPGFTVTTTCKRAATAS
jgi:hypothetical protein